MLAGLWPFDFVGTTAQLHRSLAGARWTVLAASPSDDVPPGPQQPTVSALGLLGAFAAYAFLATRAHRDQGRSRRGALKLTLEDAAILALLIETLQLFLVRGQFSLAEAGLHLAVSALAAYVAVVTWPQPLPQAVAARRPETEPGPRAGF